MIGYASATYGVCACVAALSSGYLMRRTGRKLLFIGGTTLGFWGAFMRCKFPGTRFYLMLHTLVRSLGLVGLGTTLLNVHLKPCTVIAIYIVDDTEWVSKLKHCSPYQLY